MCLLQCCKAPKLLVIYAEPRTRTTGPDDESLTTSYIPGTFIPARRRAKLGLPICLNIFLIWAYWRSRLLTSCTVVPEPRAIRLRRLPLITS
jgi:hypothetical protein